MLIYEIKYEHNVRKVISVILAGIIVLAFISWGSFEYQAGIQAGMRSSTAFSDVGGGSFVFHDFVTILIYHAGVLVYNHTFPNLITNAGEDVISRQTACGATNAPACGNGGIYIALSTDTTAPSATDTSLASEQTTNGLARALGTYSHTTGANTHQIAHTFTYSCTTCTSTTIAKVGMFDASSGGNMMAETLLSPTATVSANGDQIIITWTFTH
jgi:hypothetical protein